MADQEMAEGLALLPLERLQRMAEAGRVIGDCTRALARAGHTVVGQVLADQGEFTEWDHYPKGDVYDEQTASQYYYHAHRGPGEENGHFHVFLRGKGIPQSCRPAPYDGDAERPTGNDAIAHLIAISMDSHSDAIALFTTNRWVTGETYFDAGATIGMLDLFEIDHTYPCLATNRWITAMVRLFHPQIETLVRARDTAITAHAAAHPDHDVYEDRALEITSIRAVSVAAQIGAVERALEQKSG